jgi:hypothetical protein
MLRFLQEQSSELTKKWCDDNNYELVLFETESHKGDAIYHTDVFMYVGQKNYWYLF